MEKKMGLSYAASSSEQQAAHEGKLKGDNHKTDHDGLSYTDNSFEQQEDYENKQVETETEPPEKLLSFNKEEIIKNEPIFSVTEDEDWQKVGKYVQKEPEDDEPDIAMAGNANPTITPLKEGMKWKDLEQLPTPKPSNREKAETKYQNALDKIEEKKAAPVAHNSINSDMEMRAKGLQPDEQSVAKERTATLIEKRDFNWDNVKMVETQPDKIAQDRVYTYTDPSGHKYTEEEVHDAINKEEAFLNKRDEVIAKNAKVDWNDPSVINSLDMDTALRANGLYPDEQSVVKERTAALIEKRDFNWNNVELKQGPVDQEAVLKQYLDNGVYTDNTNTLFENNILLRDRVIELQNEGKTTNQIFNDKKVRNALGLVTDAKLVSLGVEALTLPASFGIDKFISKKIGQQAKKLGRSLGGLTTSARKSRNAQIAAERLQRVIEKRYKLNHFRETANAAKNTLTAGVSAAGMGIATGVNTIDAIQSNNNKTAIQYNPNINIEPDVNLGLETEEKVGNGGHTSSTVTVDLNLNLDSSWNDLKTALDGTVTNDNIKNKTDYLRELLENGYVETMAEAKRLKPSEKDAVYKELYNAVVKMKTITDNYTGDYIDAAKQILDNPNDYSVEDRVAARNVLDGNAYKGKLDNVFTADKTLSYIEGKLNNVRIESAFRSRNTDPDTWNNIISEMSEDARKQVLSTSSDGRFLGKDYSNVLTNGVSKAKNSFIETRNEIANKVKEITGLDKLANTVKGSKVGQLYSKSKSLIGTVISSVANPLEGVSNVIKYGVELPISVIGSSLIEAGYKTVGNFINKISDNIKIAKAGITGDADVHNMDQFEAALATKKGRAIISGMSKITEGVMSFSGSTGLSTSQIVRGVTEMMIGLDPNIDVKKINNAASQVLDALGLNNPSEEAPVASDNEVISTDEDITKKKKKIVTSDIENDEGITANAAGFNSGLGADTIKYLYENLLRQNKQS